MAKLSTFQLIFLIIFLVFIIGGTLIFAGYIKIGKSNSPSATTNASIIIWGSEKSAILRPLIDQLNGDKQMHINYIEVPAEEMNARLIDALAGGVGPDIFLLPEKDIWQFRDKVYTIPYTSYPERTYASTFIDAAKVYENKNGIVGVPFEVDPMVLYYNHDTFNSAGIALPPTSWSEFAALTPKLTVKDELGTLNASAIGMGRFENLIHGDDIFSLLTLQSGNSITTLDPVSNSLKINLGDVISGSQSGGSYALDFFTSFANPINRNYTWNRGLASDQSSFLTEHLAMYLGLASELPYIRQKNPNLNFDVTFVPQSGVTPTRVTVAHLSAFAIPINAKDKAASLSTIYELTTASFIGKLAAATSLPPVRRDLFGTKPGDQFLSVFYDSALQSKTWLNPEPTGVHTIFTDMANALISGISNSQQAVQSAVNKMSLLAAQ